jgi:hypothetical protein
MYVRTWDLLIGGDPFLGNGVCHNGLTTDGGLEDGLCRCLCLCETAFFFGGNGGLFVSFEVFDDVGGNAAGGTATHCYLLVVVVSGKSCVCLCIDGKEERGMSE